MTEVTQVNNRQKPNGPQIDGSLLAQSTGPKTYEGELYGGTVTATPLGPPGSNGQTLWRIDAHTGDGRTATVNVRLTGQFGPEQLVDGSYVKNQIGAQILADRARHIPASVSEASFLNLGMDRASARIAAEFYRSMREQGHSVARSWSFVWRTYIDGYASRGPAGGHNALTTTVTNPPPSKPNIPPTDPNAGDRRIVGPAAASTRYGEPQLLQTFQSNRWRDNEFVVYQVQNRATGNWEVRARSLRDNRRNPDLLVYTSNRPVIAADFNRTGTLLPKLSETIQALNAPANVLPSEGRANTGNARDFLVGAGSSVLFSLPRAIAGIPEGLVRNVGSLGGDLLDLAERGVDVFHPDDLSRKGFSNPIREEQRNQFSETNHSAEAVANLQRAFAQALGADPTSFRFKAGDFVGPFLLLAASAARAARAGGGQPGLSRQGPDQALRGEFRTRVQRASLDELARGVNALSREQVTRLRTQFPDEYRALTNSLAQFNNPQAASLLARLRGEGIVATGTSGTSGTSGSAATPPRNVTPTESTPTPSSSAIVPTGAPTVPTGTPTVPTTVPRTPPVETLIDRFLRNRPDMEASALRPFVQKRVADQTLDEAMRTLNDLANNPAAVQALYTEAALQQANIAVASMKVNGKVPDLYPPGQEKAATAAAFKDNMGGDAARAANQPGVVSLAFKIRTDAGVEVPAVFTGSPAEVLALLRSSAFTQGRAYVPAHFPEEAGRTIEAIKKLTGWRPTSTATATTTGGNTEATDTKTSPPALNFGSEQVPRLNPRTNDISIATRNLYDIKTLQQDTLNELADFLVRSNPESYADRTAALNALDKAGQIYVLRDAQGGILGTATLTRTADFEWYLGQVAAAPRSGAGGDVMKWLLGDFKQLAKNSNHPVRIWAYTNKAENVYNVKDPSQPGFYAQLGAKISDPNPAGAGDMTTRRPIDIEWRFDANGNPVQPEPTPPQTPPVVPHDMNTPQANVLPTVSQDSPFTFPTKPNSELTFTVGAQPFQSYDPSLAATTLDKLVIGTAAVWNSRPIEGTLEGLGRTLSTLTRPVTEWVVDIPTHIWNALPESARTQVYTVEQELRHHSDMLRRAPLDLPLGIGPAIEWVFVGPDGKESLITKFATFVDRLWQTPAVVIPMNTAKVIGFLAHKSTTALLVIEATAGGPKLHLYNPTTNQPITEPSLEALTIGYVPKTDGTIAVTLQLSLVPEASFTFFRSSEVARTGISRYDRKVTGNHQSVARIISTWHANPFSFGAIMEAGTPNLHFASGIAVRPFGEIGANPLVVQTSTNPNGGSLDVYTQSVLNPSGFINKYDTVRVGPIAITPDRGVLGLGSGYKGIVGSSGLGFNQTGYLPKVTASAFQTNPAFNFEMREQAPVAAGVSVDGEHLQVVWSVDDGEIPKVGLFMRTQGAFQIENKLFVDPATGWMALQSPHDDGPLLWVHYDIANRAKVTGQGRGGTFDEAEFGVNWSVATSDQWLQALQTEPGLTRVRNAILELGGGDLDKGLRQLSDKVADPDVRRLIIDNTAYFKALTQNRN